MRRLRVFLSAVLLMSLLLSWTGGIRSGAAQSSTQEIDAQTKARTLMAQMTPEERVGQLFLVTFDGTATDSASPVYNLVVNYHIGGVMLRADKNNFVGPENTTTAALHLNQELQTLNWNVGQATLAETGPTDAAQTPYIPLFIGVVQEGNGAPEDSIMSGLTPLPSQMALGAAWKPTLAYQTGQILGRELSRLGFNLIFGPSLDVLDTPSVEASDDLGTRAFGGDPYWVAEMGKAYIRGLHQGAQGSLAVIAKHFPGRGDSDRPPEEEVATVRKSLEQLKQIELAPFFAVTSGTTDEDAQTDGLLVSHIRYQGFQGNIRATTRPVSFDQTALETILALPEFTNWRSNGGIVVSDDLGSLAVRKFFESTGSEYDPRQVARYALLAGNDLLYVNNLQAPGDPDSTTTIIRTLSFLTQKYAEDPAFAETIDSSVERLLTLKYSIYPEFTPDQVLPDGTDIATLGNAQQTTFDTLRSAATLVNPTLADLDSVLPRAPELRDQIVFLTDTRTAKQCAKCLEQAVLSVDAMKSAVLKLYGPAAGGEVQESRLSSFSFQDLKSLLDDPTTRPELEQSLQQADWIIVLLQKPDAAIPSSNAFKQLLAERLALVRNKRLIVFSLGAPYYLDATDISRLTAYYALYDKTSGAADVAARLLFRELLPNGTLPVSVPAVGYDLLDATTPDPAQIIPLIVDMVTPSMTPEGMQTPLPTPMPLFKIGDLLPLRTGEIIDQNGHQVPDGTIVRFFFTIGGDVTTAQQVEALTSGGVARTVYRIQSPGLIQIRVTSEPAMTSQVLQLDVTELGASITALAPTPISTGEAEATDTAQVETTPAPELPGNKASSLGFLDWLSSGIIIAAMGIGAFFGGRRINLRWAWRWACSTVAGGWLGYLYLQLGLPGTQAVIEDLGIWGVLIFVVVGGLLGFGIGYLWRREQYAVASAKKPK